MSDLTEALYLDIQFKQYHFLLVVVYRPNRNEASQWLPNDTVLLNNIKTAAANNTVIIVGDFNYSDISWPLTSDQVLSGPASLFQETFFDSSLEQLVTQPTRFQTGNNPSLLDLVMTNEPDLIADITYLSPIGKSDHCVLEFGVQYLVDGQSKVKSAQRRPLHRINFEAFENDLSECLSKIDVVAPLWSQWSSFRNAVDTTLDLHAPLREIRPRRKNKPWINDEIKDMIEKKKTLWNIYVMTNSRDNYRAYRECSNACTSASRRQRSKYETNIINSGDKPFYAHLRSCLSSKVSVPPAIRDPQGNLATEPRSIADVFATEFMKAYSSEPPVDDGVIVGIPRAANSLSDIEFTAQDVLKVLNNLDDQAAAGPDGIPGVVLKKCARSLAPLLAFLMNESFSSGQLPSDWKHAVVTPVFKKGDKLCAANYRPISLTSIPCKCMERIICNKLKGFLFREDLVPDRQHGFVEKRSTVTNLLTSIHQWQLEVDAGNPVDIFYLDFERAFDKVPHKRLLIKLEHLGIRGKLLEWLRDYLTDRTFQVRIGGELSDNKDVLSGVPQGSVLAPALFGLYVSDLCSSFASEACFFADDVKFFGNPIINSDVLQRDLEHVQEWTKDWIIRLNPSKCSVLHVGRNNPKKNYTIGNVAVSSVMSQRDLGVIVSSDLKWAEHIDSVVKRANSLLYAIQRSFQHLTPETALKIHKTFVRPLLEYAFQVWNPYLVKDINYLESVQRRVTKLPYCLRKESYERRLELLGLTTLQVRRARGDLIETFKIITGKYSCPNLDAALLKLRRNPRDRSKNNKNLSRISANTNILYHCLNNRVLSTWNQLPQEVVDATSTNSFKNRLDKWLKSEK